jgi:hypothetical protein
MRTKRYQHVDVIFGLCFGFVLVFLQLSHLMFEVVFFQSEVGQLLQLLRLTHQLVRHIFSLRVCFCLEMLELFFQLRLGFCEFPFKEGFVFQQMFDLHGFVDNDSLPVFYLQNGRGVGHVTSVNHVRMHFGKAWLTLASIVFSKTESLSLS